MSRSIERTLPPSVPGNPTRSSKKEEATLRRVFGFVASASLLIAAPWWVNSGQSAEPVRVCDAAGNADSPLPADRAPSRTAPSLTGSQHFLQGRQDYLAGRFAEAVAQLEAASRASGDLNDADRERLPGWLAQARSKLITAKLTTAKMTAAKAAGTGPSAKDGFPDSRNDSIGPRAVG